MTAFIDTGILAKLYSPEPNSPQAMKLVQDFAPPFPLAHLQEIELRTAIRLKRFRKEIDDATLGTALELYNEDLRNGFLKRADYDLAEVYRAAESLSSTHAIRIGCRTLDILQVATALVIQTSDFLSYDKRQRDLARKAGLKIHPRSL